jgi:hypothetical protein
VKTERGRWFLEECRQRGLQVEHELHAMSDLLPRSLFDKNPAMFPMNDKRARPRLQPVPPLQKCPGDRLRKRSEIYPGSPLHHRPLFLLARRRSAHVPVPQVQGSVR